MTQILPDFDRHNVRMGKAKSFRCSYFATALHVCILLILISFTNCCLGQLDTIHFIPPFGTDNTPNERPGNVHIYLSTPSTTPVNYTITDAANTVILNSGTVVAGTPVRYDSYGVASGVAVYDADLNTPLSSDVGFKVVADSEIYVNLRVRSDDNAQAGSLTSKGQNAYGQIFRLGSIPNQQNNSNKATTFGIIATDDNTTVQIDMTGSGVTLQGTGAPNTNAVITVNLNEGECYVMRAEADVDPDNLDGMIGTLVTSNKPIVVNTGSWCGEPTTSGGRDYGIDQIVGLQKVGNEYIFVRASGGDDRELPMIVAHFDNTEIYVNGNGAPVATINAGEYHLINGSNYVNEVMHVQTSQDVFAYQILAGNNAGNTAGMNFVPDISCQIEDVIDAVPDVHQIGSNNFSGGMTITTFAGSEIYINGVLETSTPETITLASGDSYDIYKLSGLTGDHQVVSNTMAIVSFFGVSGVAGYGGYFSGFARPQSVSLNPDPLSADAVENCVTGLFTIERAGDLSVPLDVDISIAGTATYGVDYVIQDLAGNEIPSVIQFAPGESIIGYGVFSLPDNLNEVVETVVVSMGWAVCNEYSTLDQTLNIYDPTVSIVCPSDTIIGFNPGSCAEGDFIFSNPLPTSLCPMGLTRIDGTGLNSGDAFPEGSTTLTWEASINSGQITAVCSQTVTVADITPPSIQCPVDIVTSTDPGLCSSGISLSDPTVIEDCNFVLTNDAPDPFPIGTTSVTWTATDESGNTDTCVQNVTVDDNEPPVITCGSDLVIDANYYGYVSQQIVFEDFEGGASGWSINTTENSTWSQFLGRFDGNDIVSKTFSLPSDGTTQVDFDFYRLDSWDGEDFQIFINGVEIFSESFRDNNSGGAFTGGSGSTGDVSWVATPTSTLANHLFGSWADQIFHFTLTINNPGTALEVGFEATTDQAINDESWGIDNLSIEQPTLQCGATYSLANPTTSDNCGNISITSDAPSEFPLGTTTVNWTATDDAGNTSYCSQDVTVTESEAPVISCAPDVNLTAGNLSYLEDFEGGASGWSDNTTENSTWSEFLGRFAGNNLVSKTYTLNGSSNDVQLEFDFYRIDSWDNEDFHVYIDGSLAVDITLSQSGSGYSGGYGSFGNISWTATPLSAQVNQIFSGWTDQMIHFVLTIASPESTLELGFESTVDQSVSDESWGIDNLSIIQTSSECEGSITLTEPTVTDNCGIALLTNDAPTTYPIGVTTVTWTATDLAGNSSSCEQLVNVTENVDPTISCPPDLIVGTSPASCEATSVDLGTPSASDNCSSVSTTNDAPTVFPLGTTTVTWIATDASGNTAQCTQTVTVIDDVDPLINCPSNVSVEVNMGECEASGVMLGTPSTSDNCGVASVTNDAPSSFPIGMTVVTWTVIDNSGNYSSCDQTITVQDNEDPTIVCLGNQNIPFGCGLPAYSQLATALDNCPSGLTISQFPAAGTPITTTTTITLTATDSSGNSASCSFDVSLLDSTAPIIVCPNDPVIELGD